MFVKSHSEDENNDNSSQIPYIKQGWTQLKNLHCKLLPEKIVNNGSKNYKRIQIEMLANCWQHNVLKVNINIMIILILEIITIILFFFLLEKIIEFFLHLSYL